MSLHDRAAVLHTGIGSREVGEAIEQLHAGLSGRLILPSDPDYDAARTLFYGGMDPHPAAIVRVANAADVARVISAARDSGVELAVRSGGHSVAGHSVSDGGLVLDLHDLRALELDPAGRTAWAETGLTAGEYTTAAAEHGLATGFGDTASVGLGGLTLGGGVGYLVRKHGLTIDSLLAADVVTADGQLRRVDDQHDPDLFWAIRGGGGNFGVATRFQYRLHPVNSVVGGMLILPATPDTIRRFVAEAQAAPEELSGIANIMPAPPMPFIPAEAHGQLIILGLMAFVGPAEAGERAFAPFRALAKPIADMIRPITYPEMFPPEEEGYHPTAVSQNLFLDRVDEATAELIVETLKKSDAAFRAVQLRALGGAMARVPMEATAYAHRQAPIMANLAAFYTSPEEKPARAAWVADFAAALPTRVPGSYVNFVGEEGDGRVREAYPGRTWDRLREIKARYDPTNLFRLNHNIPPAVNGSD